MEEILITVNIPRNKLEGVDYKPYRGNRRPRRNHKQLSLGKLGVIAAAAAIFLFVVVGMASATTIDCNIDCSDDIVVEDRDVVVENDVVTEETEVVVEEPELEETIDDCIGACGEYPVIEDDRHFLSEDERDTYSLKYFAKYDSGYPAGYDQYIGQVRVTFYCTCPKCCGIWSQDHPSRVGTDYVQKTRTGTVCEEGRTVSVDPSFIPLGTKLYLEGYGMFTAEDTGSAVKGAHIDVFCSSHEEAVKCGVADGVDVYILPEE